MFWETRSRDQIMRQKKKAYLVKDHKTTYWGWGEGWGDEVQNKIIFAQGKIK